jgi:hypothetical protein
MVEQGGHTNMVCDLHVCTCVLLLVSPNSTGKVAGLNVLLYSTVWHSTLKTVQSI